MTFTEGSWEGDGPNGAAFLGARIGLGTTTALVLELPYARVDARHRIYDGYFEVSRSEVGNPYLGIELQPIGSVSSPSSEVVFRFWTKEGSSFNFGIRGTPTGAASTHSPVPLRRCTPSGTFDT